ncbi:hypothetical protein [Flavihumibacter sp. ZG627]|uniref:hypothetical protein n=1 Tax=Flavihumibacter sp. ZG627 TaxID=1463156 RepID=UPI00057C9ACC|nr:hypothetical protein [Flavihumibacter sp. ZG627]KIC89488.1 hypothetical protein HY58_16630 [Flavihumibacter sp. ZG627]
MNPIGKKWCRIALFNLLLVATAGVLLRLKILTPLTWLNHKYMLHAHSHFAFAGWVSLFLMAAMIGNLPEKYSKGYERILIAYTITAYGMLFSFPFQGYGAVSIFFSTLSVLVSWWFAIRLWKSISDENICPVIVSNTKWSLAFLILSAVGTFYLAWLMANKVDNPSLYFGAVYFYLHFQYNGWFFFSITALFLSRVSPAYRQKLKRPLQILALACIPAFFLSALWMRLPSWMYYTAGAAAIVQLFAFGQLLLLLVRDARNHIADKVVQTIWGLSLLALAIKFLLQSLSVFPSLSKYAFAYRPVVIGYLHLVLLGFVSLFQIGWLIKQGCLPSGNQKIPASVWAFITGFILTEGTLMAQGISSMFFVAIPHTNEMLLVAALFLFAGIAWMNRQVWWRTNNSL